METLLKDLPAFEAAAISFAGSLQPRSNRATLVTLQGDLGAGKTTFVQSVARALGVTEHVTSPTFVLAKSYDLSGQPFERLVHIDAYRLKDGDELSGIRFENLMQDSGNLVMLEWPEVVYEALPDADVSIQLVANEDGTRTMTYA